MLTIGRTLDVNQISSAINVIKFVKIGNLLLLLLSIKMDALIKLLVYSPMGGKSNNIIHYFIKLNNVMRQFKTYTAI
jgi:hypothetical protein